MDIIKAIINRFRRPSRYDISISFVVKDGIMQDRIEGYLSRRDYRRLIREHASGRRMGTYLFTVHIPDREGEDWTPDSITFPIEDIDMIHAVPEIEKL